MQNHLGRIGLVLSYCFLLSVSLSGQTHRQYTTADYKRAESFMSYSVNPLLLHGVDDPHWLADGRAWYRDQGADGMTFFVIDPQTGSKQKAFDQVKLAAALSSFDTSDQEPGTPAPIPRNPAHLEVDDFTLTDNDRTVTLLERGRQLRCNLFGTAGMCKRFDGPPMASSELRPVSKDEAVSPDGRTSVFIRDWNLFLRDRATGRETKLTTDGVPNFGYATDNAGWRHSESPVVVWSPDSRRIATYQQDQRNVGEVYLTDVKEGRPSLTALKYAFPGDKNVPMLERVIINLPPDSGAGERSASVVRLKMQPDQRRPSQCTEPDCGLEPDMQWGDDSGSFAFVSVARDSRQMWMRIADPDTGAVRDVMHETSARMLESGVEQINWRYLSSSKEMVWFSEKSGWGHLYLYETSTGRLKNQITTGEWNVAVLLDVDQKHRTLSFVGRGRERGENPYYWMYYRVGFDGRNLQLLTPERADHTITPSPDHRYFVDAYSTPSEPQIAVLRDASGKVVTDVARMDIAKLLATGWKPPVAFTVKAHDGVTDLYGLMYRPTNFSETKRYPIVNSIYPGPQVNSCPARSFWPAVSGWQALAELGFVVVCIDPMGTPFRSRAFQDAYSLDDNTIPDQVAGMKELASRYPWIDLDRAGIYGHSGGGAATAQAMFQYPDFFKVGVAESGNYDNRVYTDMWGELWLGLETANPDGTTNFDSQAKQTLAKNLKGHLLLAVGSMDDNVPPLNTMLVVDALIKANRDFDLLVIPNARHSYGKAARYMTRRRWDYFVRYLAECVPPFDYQMKTP